VQLRNLDEIEFLKRKFVFDNVLLRYIAPLRLDVVLEIPYWTKRGAGKSDTITMDNLQLSLDELSLHGKTIFTKYSKKMVEKSQGIMKMCPKRFLYSACREFILNSEHVY